MARQGIVCCTTIGNSYLSVDHRYEVRPPYINYVTRMLLTFVLHDA